MRTLRNVALFLLVLTATVPVEAQRRRPVAPPSTPVVNENETPQEWLRRNAIPFATTEARTGVDDLRPLRNVVRDARFVALGEATHGSREFFTMKHRVLEYLVQEMGFTVFAIEASLPESDRINRYVQTGEGDPATLVAGMGFWTWNTEEVVDMVRWMREYNLARGDRPAISFRGFDMQFVGVAVNDIGEYVRRYDASNAASIERRYDCVRQYGTSWTGFEASSGCRANITAAYDAIAGARDRYVAASGLAEYDRILRYARVVVQAEEHISGGGTRELSMVENMKWLADSLHPDEKFVLWAHNFHVGMEDTVAAMGYSLRQHYGTAYMAMGFAFNTGGFIARPAIGLAPTRHQITVAPEGGWEEFFASGGHSRYFIDLRAPQSTRTLTYLRQRRSVWAIGSLYIPGNANTYRTTNRIIDAYDVVIWIAQVTAARSRVVP